MMVVVAMVMMMMPMAQLAMAAGVDETELIHCLGVETFANEETNARSVMRTSRARLPTS